MTAQLELGPRDGEKSCVVPCVHIAVHTQIGEQAKWHFRIEASQGSELTTSVAKTLGIGECWAQLKWTSDTPQMLSPKVLVSRAFWFDENKKWLVVEGTPTVLRPGSNGQDPLKPHYRAHRVGDLAQLFRRFDRFLEIPNHIMGVLQSCKLADEMRSTVFQNGLTDWDFFRQVLLQYADRYKTLLMAPNVADESDSGRPWILVWDTVEANQKAGIANHAVRWSQADGPIYEHFDSLGLHELGCFCPSKTFPSLGAFAPHREFQPQSWNAWRLRVIPTVVVDRSGLVWKSRDEIVFNVGSLPVWSTWLSEIGTGVHVRPDSSRETTRPCLCTGVVTNASPTEPWVEVKLNGFEPPDNLAWARLLTASSGRDQKTGLHLTPAVGSVVAIGFSGNFTDSVWLLGNVRSEAATTSAPSISADGKLSLVCDQIETQSQQFGVTGRNITLKTGGVQLSLNEEKVSVGTP